MNKPNKYIIHHSLTDDNKVLSDFEAIRNYHINVNGWNDIGYHGVFEYVKGKLTFREGRKPETVGAHTLGQNDKSLGFCVVGNFDKTKPTQELYDFIAKTLYEKYIPKYGELPIERHNKYANKSCPGKHFDVNMIKNSIENIINKKEKVNKVSNTPDWKIAELNMAYDNKIITDKNYWLERIVESDTIRASEVLAMLNNLYDSLKK